MTDYLERAGLIEPLEQLGFNLVGYGCTTCIGNSGPLPEEVSQEINERDLAVCSVLSGNRNFEGRIHPEVKLNYLASPPLCVAYALAGRMDLDLLNEPARRATSTLQRHLAHRSEEVRQAIERRGRVRHVPPLSYGEVFEGDEDWNALRGARGRPLRLGRRVHLRQAPALLRGHGRRSPPRASSRSPAPGCSPCWATA